MRGITALTLGAALLLSGCGSSEEESATPSASASTESPANPVATEADIAALAAVQLVGDPGTEPTLEFTAPFTTTAPVARVVTEGTGDEIASGAQVSLNIVSYDGATGEMATSTWEATPQSVIVGDAQIISALSDALTGQKVGAQLVVANPSADSTLLMAVEVMSTRIIPTRAEGEAVAPVEGLPTVTLDETGRPTVSIPEDYAAPTELVAQTLIKGTGPVVEAGQTIQAHYAGWKLSDGTLFEASWDTGTPISTAIGTGAVIPGWDQGLVGQTVGSQVLLVIPKSLAYEGSGNDLADEDLVFVVDILSAE